MSRRTGLMTMNLRRKTRNNPFFGYPSGGSLRKGNLSPMRAPFTHFLITPCK
jgi:hypothetical protein